MRNKVISFERKRENTHTLVLTLEKPLSNIRLPETLINRLDGVGQDWDYSGAVFCFYNIPDDLEDTYKEKLTAVLERYA